MKAVTIKLFDSLKKNYSFEVNQTAVAQINLIFLALLLNLNN
jgi:hypothetical protein